MYKVKKAILKKKGITGWEYDYLSQKVFKDGKEIVISKKQIEAKAKELEAKAVIDAKAQDIENYIYSNYPAKEQAQDNGWKENFRTKLVAGGVADIDTQIVTLAASFLKGKKLNLVLKGVDSKVKPMFEKLVKIAVKSEWMLDCINAGKTAIKNNEEADYPVFPKFD
jgi:hypothetical protein